MLQTKNVFVTHILLGKRAMNVNRQHVEIIERSMLFGIMNVLRESETEGTKMHSLAKLVRLLHFNKMYLNWNRCEILIDRFLYKWAVLAEHKLLFVTDFHAFLDSCRNRFEVKTLAHTLTPTVIVRSSIRFSTFFTT